MPTSDEHGITDYGFLCMLGFAVNEPDLGDEESEEPNRKGKN